ncbi:MAG TPA: hypothetical protein DEG69_13620 [Flavobacteriaceae bacterium]|nr:hypothetical protein [Flavobacteriaceae bacterium]|tara:strand:- start:170 stop:370 length:201 start_codon:yes stop_codon:yes gene_type:complete
MAKENMNFKETFFVEGFGALLFAFAGVKLEDISSLASMGANFFAMIVSSIAIFTFIRNERRKSKGK